MSARDDFKTEWSHQFVCQFAGCNKVFKRKDRLCIHLRVHTGERPFVCGVVGCGKSYSRSQHLTRHVQNTHRVLAEEKTSSTFSCPVCRRDLANTNCLQQHMKAEHVEIIGPKRYVCPERDCGQTFHKKRQLVSHRLQDHTAHVADARRCHRCPQQGCDQTFTWMNQLRRHMKIHQGYPCTTKGCDKVLPTWSSLRKHKARDHAQVFSCEQCGIKFSRRPNLNQHMKRKHEGLSKKFSCQVEGCGRVYNYKSNLILHNRECHEGENVWKERPRKRTLKKATGKVSLAAKLCGLDDRGEELKLQKRRRKRAPASRNKLFLGEKPDALMFEVQARRADTFSSSNAVEGINGCAHVDIQADKRTGLEVIDGCAKVDIQADKRTGLEVIDGCAQVDIQADKGTGSTEGTSHHGTCWTGTVRENTLVESSQNCG